MDKLTRVDSVITSGFAILLWLQIGLHMGWLDAASFGLVIMMCVSHERDRAICATIEKVNRMLDEEIAKLTERADA